MNKVILLYGPTAVGKSSIAIELAKLINGEIISADSMQVYQKLNVGTAKVTKEQMQGVPHHLLDILSPSQNYSVSDFCSDCNRLIEEIMARGKTPIVVGGTGLYFKSLIDGYDFGQTSRNDEFRASLENLSNQEIYKRILEYNPSITIDCNNRHRLVRALELLAFGKMPTKKKNVFKYPYKLFVLSDDRQKIYERINKRVDEMVNDGILDEVKFLLSLNLPDDNLCLKAIGYKELIPYVNGEESLESCLELLKQKTRNYAKRQFTFINQFKEKEIINFCGVKETANIISKKIGE